MRGPHPTYGDDLAHFDAPYAAKLCRALAAALGSLAFAPAPPAAVKLGGAVSPDTPSLNSNNSHVVSQYDVACFQVSTR